jgi:glycosyltransferase involved in cell wall biosynthesis
MKVNFHAPIVIADGYGSASCNIMLWMDKLGLDVYPINMYPSSTNIRTLPTRIVELMQKKEEPGDLMYYVNPAFAKFHPRFKGQPIVVMSMLETTKIPDIWAKRYSETQLVHNPSQWGKEVFKSCGVTTEIEVMNLGVPPEKVNYIEREFNTPFIFLFVAVEINDARKNATGLVSAFCKAFEGNPDVELWIKTKTRWNWPVPEDDNIVIIEGEATQEEMNEFMEKANCFVFPTKGEGFGLPPLEAMATGLPVIATNYSAMTEYLSPEVAYLLDIKYMEDIDQRAQTSSGSHNYHVGTFGEGIGQWAIPDEEHLAQLMVEVYENYDEASVRGFNAYKMVQQEWTYDKKVSNIISSLERLLK